MPPCSEFIELLTLLVGVDDCCTAPFSFIRWKDDCDPATPLEPSLVAPCALSAFFLLLKRNAIVPSAGSRLYYANVSLVVVTIFIFFRSV